MKFTKKKAFSQSCRYLHLSFATLVICITVLGAGPMLSITISRFVRLSVRPSVCLYVREFTFEVPFQRLLAPTSQSWMSNIFRDSESLGKVMKRSVLRFEIFFGKCLKSPKKIVFLEMLFWQLSNIIIRQDCSKNTRSTFEGMVMPQSRGQGPDSC